MIRPPEVEVGRDVASPAWTSQRSRSPRCRTVPDVDASSRPPRSLPIVRGLPAATAPELLVGSATGDDAAVWRISDELALVQTVDFFTPVVDDPYDFGRIAAANALSDVYAMGGRPLTALNIVAWPLEQLGADALGEVLRGGLDVVRAAGAEMVGGHSIDDPEPKYGLAVTGAVHPDRVIANAGGRPGDALVADQAAGRGRGGDRPQARAGRRRAAGARGGRHGGAQRRRGQRGGGRGRVGDDRRHGLRPARATCTGSRARAGSLRASTPRPSPCSTAPSGARGRERAVRRQPAQPRVRRRLRVLRRGRGAVAPAARLRRDDVGRAARGGRSRARRRGARSGGGRLLEGEPGAIAVV